MYDSETRHQRSPVGFGRLKTPTFSPLVAITRLCESPWSAGLEGSSS